MLEDTPKRVVLNRGYAFPGRREHYAPYNMESSWMGNCSVQFAYL